MVSYIIVQHIPDKYKGIIIYQEGFIGLTVKAQIIIPELNSFLPELKADANIACGCFTYLLANG
jgi:hypothetical protein